MKKIIAIIVGCGIILTFFYLADMRVSNTLLEIDTKQPAGVFKPFIDRILSR